MKQFLIYTRESMVMEITAIVSRVGWGWRFYPHFQRHYPCCIACRKWSLDAHLASRHHQERTRSIQQQFDFPGRERFIMQESYKHDPQKLESRRQVQHYMCEHLQTQTTLCVCSEICALQQIGTSSLWERHNRTSQPV